MPNGTRLLYLADVLTAAFSCGEMFYNFTVKSGRDGRTRSAVSKWATECNLSFSGGGERDETEILRIAMRPVEINYGDFTSNQQSKI
jgi:hypothetical protein